MTPERAATAPAIPVWRYRLVAGAAELGGSVADRGACNNAVRGLRRAFSLGFPADAIAVFIHWRVAAEPAAPAISFFSLSRAALAELGGRLRRDRLAPGW